MKKIFFAILLSAGTTLAFAQTKTSTSTVYNADQMSRQMYQDLELNEAQYLQVKSLNKTRADRMRDLDQMYRNDPQMRQERMDALNQEMDREYQSVLRPEQYQSYLETEGRSANAGTEGQMIDQMDMQGAEMKVKTNDMKIKSEPGESKLKTDEMKVKSEPGESKVKTDHVKIKSEDDRYKYQDSRDNSKVKITDDKLKIEDKNGKLKVEEDKVKIKSRD